MSQNGSVFQRPNGGWYVKYRDATGKQIMVGGKKRFPTKAKAQTFLRQVLHQVDEGTHVAPTKDTLRKFVEQSWFVHLDGLVAGGRMRPTTRQQYRTLMSLHVLPRLGDYRLTAIEASKLNAIYAELLTSGRKDGKGGLSTTTVHLVHVTISRCLKDAVKVGKLARNVAANAEPPQPKNAEKEIWSPEQMRTFLESVKAHRLYALWLLLASTGMRRGEAAGLTWADVDLDAGELRIRQARVVVDYAVVESGPKTEKGRRTVALDDIAVAALRKHRASQSAERLAWGPAYTDSGLVFTAEDGAGLHPDRITRGFKAQVRKASLPMLTPHGVRHSYATMLRDAGVKLEVVSKRLGHSSIAITADLYQHRTDESDRAAANAGALRLAGG